MTQIKLLIFLLLAFVPYLSHAQKTVYYYQTYLCDCHGEFDSTQYSREALKNTRDHLWMWSILSADATASELSGINNLSVEEVDEAYAEKMKIYEKLTFVQDSFWTNLKNELITYYRSAHSLMRLTILAYENPDTLMNYNRLDSIGVFYRDALIAGGNELLAAWDVLNEHKKSQNGSPERLQRIYEEQLNSPRKYEYARLDVMRYGWWNAANHVLPHISRDYRYNEHFERLFSDVKCSCVDP